MPFVPVDEGARMNVENIIARINSRRALVGIIGRGYVG
jgi:hypothetical protein